MLRTTRERLPNTQIYIGLRGSEVLGREKGGLAWAWDHCSGKALARVTRAAGKSEGWFARSWERAFWSQRLSENLGGELEVTQQEQAGIPWMCVRGWAGPHLQSWRLYWDRTTLHSQWGTAKGFKWKDRTITLLRQQKWRLDWNESRSRT